MSLLFPDFENTKLHYVGYRHDPLVLFFRSFMNLRDKSGGDHLLENLVNMCSKLFGLYISARPVNYDQISVVRDNCKIHRSDLVNELRTIYTCLNYISQERILANTLEKIVLENPYEKYTLLIDSDEQWSFIKAILVKGELDVFIETTLKKDARERYYKTPIITFYPASWIPELLTLPISENIFLIHPENLRPSALGDAFFKAPNGDSIELSIDSINTIHHEIATVSADKNFYDKLEFDNHNNSDDISTYKVPELNQRPISDMQLQDIHGHVQHIQANKSYLTVFNTGEIEFSSFENADQLSEVLEIVTEIDYSNLSEENLKLAKTQMMEKWKKPLRESVSMDDLVLELEEAGAIRAKPQNIRNWISSSNIAPGSDQDYYAVLKYAGIDSEEEIDTYFQLARKQRGASISYGHQKSLLVRDIVRNYLINKNNNDSNLNTVDDLLGIKIKIVRLGGIVDAKNDT